MCFWAFMYIYYYAKNTIPDYVAPMMIANGLIILVALIIGFGVVRISIEQWFPETGGLVPQKDRILLSIYVAVDLICMVTFMLNVSYRWLFGIKPPNAPSFLHMIVINSLVSFAYYQHFRVARFMAKQKRENDEGKKQSACKK